MDVSVVIVSYNGKELLRRCLVSVFEHTREVDFEVIVVDNASKDGTPEMLMTESPKVAAVCRPDNAGFARAVNEGITIARGQAFFLLNPDSELLGDVIGPMLTYLREHRDIGILAPKLLDADGTLQLSCRAFPRFETALFNRYSPLTRLFPNNRRSTRYLMRDFDHASIADVDWASAACWLLPRVAHEKVGPLDEGYFWSIEDVDYCQRMHRAGLRVVYYPQVAVRHHIGGSSSSASERAITARHRGMWRYYRSYLRPGSPVARAALDPMVWSGIQARRLWHLATARLRR